MISSELLLERIKELERDVIQLQEDKYTLERDVVKLKERTEKLEKVIRFITPVAVQGELH